MIKKMVFAAIMIASVSGITSCVATDYEDDFNEVQPKASKNVNHILIDTISTTNQNEAELTDAVEDDGDREKWGNTKRN